MSTHSRPDSELSTPALRAAIANLTGLVARALATAVARETRGADYETFLATADRAESRLASLRTILRARSDATFSERFAS